MRRLTVALAASMFMAACGFPELTCPDAGDLESLVACLTKQMPKDNSEGFIPPTADQQSGWRAIVTQMMQGSCTVTIPASLDGLVRVRPFTDSSNGRTYCLLMEVQDRNRDNFVDHGFGAVVVYNAATRQLSHQAVHPVADSRTELEAVTVFKNTDSRSFVIAGSHRDANAKKSTCITDFPESDASHNRATMVQATDEALLAFYGDAPWFVIEWHGKAATTCRTTDVFPSHGRDVTPAPTDKISILKEHLITLHSSWRVNLPGSGACDLNATENVQGRLLNGIAADAVCTTPAPGYTQRFVHIEQSPDFRNAADWIAAITATFP